MKARDVVNEVIFIPRKFHSVGNMSIYDLLRETGYFTMHEKVSEASIREALNEHPECVDEWMRYSEDKRTSSGWYFKQENESKFIVGYFSGKASNDIKLTFTNKMEACVEFIERELKNVMEIIQVKHAVPHK